MTALLLALVLLADTSHGLDAGSLGIGMDVLPEAFSFAARRVTYAPELRLTRCNAELCQWRLGDGLAMTAHLSQKALDVSRVEARLETPASPVATTQYRKACLAIVALFDPEAGNDRLNDIAGAIAAPPSDAADVAAIGGGVRFYGRSHRCGAAAVSAARDE